MGTQATVCISQMLIAGCLHAVLSTFRHGLQIFSDFFFKLLYTLCPTHKYALGAS